MFHSELEKILVEMPENSHKILVMYSWHKLMKKIKIPYPFTNNVELVQCLAEFSLNFLTAIGFSTGVIASKEDSDPTTKLAIVASSISFLIPFIINVLIKLKISGKKDIFPMCAYTSSQITSIFAVSGVFIHGLKLCGSATSLSVTEQVKSNFLVAMAGVYAGHYSGILSYQLLMRAYEIIMPIKNPALSDSLLPQSAIKTNLEKIKSTIVGYESTRELQFLIVLFILMIVNINQGAIESTRDRGFDNPFALNVVLLPVTSILASVLHYLYSKLIGR
jgi:hypothetical protein